MPPHLFATGGYQAFVLGGAERAWLVFALATGLVAIATALYLMRGCSLPTRAPTRCARLWPWSKKAPAPSCAGSSRGSR